MLALTGNYTLWVSLLFSAFQIIIFSDLKNYNLVRFNKVVVNILLLSCLISFFILTYAHVISDFSILNVYQNSHSTKPLIYKISGVWGNHEGSMLLWILVLTIFNYFLFKLYNKKNSKFISKTLQTQGLIIFGFIFFTILTSNPFEKAAVIQNDGLGFNPILQDPALAIHPPLLYLGYVGFSAAFSLSIATLNLSNGEKIPWNIYMKPFVMAAWSFLTIGIALGSIWAYYELGWGGWWFWDPVENASFMPWLVGTALLHSLITVEKNKSLQSWVILLSLITFLLSIIGTFLVRSGILTSVHTFALDPSRGVYILIFTALLGIYSLILFSLKSKNYLNNNYISFFSKEGSILINNILMIVVTLTIFLGTIYPLLVEAFTNNKISVGEPYYNSTVNIIMIPAILVMGVGPILSWGNKNTLKVFKKLLPVIFISILITLLIFLFYKYFNIMSAIGIFLSFWIIFNSINLFFQKKINHPTGMMIAHLGVGLLLLGIVSSSNWQEEQIAKMKIGDQIKIKEYNILFKDIKEVKGKNYIAIQGNFSVQGKKKKNIDILKPENRFYPITNSFTSEVSIHTNLIRDLYIVLGEGNITDGWTVRLYYNPLVSWIWIGSFIIFLGGIITVKTNLKKLYKTL